MSSSRQAMCPCCLRVRTVSPDSPPFSIERQMEAQATTPWWAKPGWTSRRNSAVRWACSRCLADGRALQASPAAQTYCCSPPYLAYFDQTLKCTDCGQPFVFTKTEQRFWYETRSFIVQSRPKQCVRCRRARRVAKQSQARLQAALSRLDPRDPAQLAAVGMLYLELGSRRKAAEFLRRAKNRATNDNERLELLRALERAEQPHGHPG